MLMLSHRFHRFTQMIILHTDDNGYPRIAFIRLTKTTQDKPLAVDANVSASLLCCSRLKTLEQAQIFSACYTITLRALYQPQGDKPKINIISVAYWKIMENMLRSACKAVLSEAVVTRDTVPGLDAWGELSVRQYLAIYLV